jgi:hypothetical protein
MAWPKLRNKSSASLMTDRNRSGAAQHGARSQENAAGDAPADTARGVPGPEPAPSAAAEVRSAEAGPVSWPGRGEVAAEVAEPEVAAEPEPGDLPLWDWSPPAERGEPSGQLSDRAPDQPEPSGREEPAAAVRAEPPRPEWRPVVTPVEEAGGDGRPWIGPRRGNLGRLSANPRMRIWQLRAVAAVVILVAFWILVSWQLGLTLAVLAVIADTIYRSRRNYAGKTRLTGAQKRTRRQLNKLDRAGYRAMHARPIPESEDQIDHLVVGPAGVFAIDSEDWNKRLPVRTKNARQLWHGPYSKKDRLEHAQWEAQRAADLLSSEIGKPVSVRPAMAVYGPRIPWDVATIREVDVFSGPRLRRYLRRRARNAEVRPLTDEEIERIFKAAGKAFPHFSSGSPAR